MGWNEGCITRESLKHNRTEQENDCLQHLFPTLHGLCWVSSCSADIYQGQLTIILFVVENKWIGVGKHVVSRAESYVWNERGRMMGGNNLPRFFKSCKLNNLAHLFTHRTSREIKTCNNVEFSKLTEVECFWTLYFKTYKNKIQLFSDTSLEGKGKYLCNFWFQVVSISNSTIQPNV